MKEIALLFSLLPTFMIIQATDLQTHATIALFLGVASLAILCIVFITGHFVFALLSAGLNVFTGFNAFRVLKNKEATRKQRKQAKTGLILSFLAWLAILGLTLAFNYWA